MFYEQINQGLLNNHNLNSNILLIPTVAKKNTLRPVLLMLCFNYVFYKKNIKMNGVH